MRGKKTIDYEQVKACRAAEFLIRRYWAVGADNLDLKDGEQRKRNKRCGKRAEKICAALRKIWE